MSSLEEQLMRASEGDARAFAAVHDATAARAVGLATRVLVDRAQAEEVAQEAFLHAWLQAGEFDPERGTAAGWILQIVHRRAVDRVRQSQAHRDRDLRDWARSRATVVASVHERVEMSVDAAEVREALSRLSVVQREAIFLAYFGGLTQAEIAEQLGVPLGTVKTRMRDGMRRLRRSFGIVDEVSGRREGA